MESIDLYEIHDSVYTNRVECNDCPSLKGYSHDNFCSLKENEQHEDCPFVSQVLDEVNEMETSYYRTLLTEFIDEAMDLELNEEDSKELSTRSFADFLKVNKALFKPKLTAFFVKRLADENNYRGVEVCD